MPEIRRRWSISVYRGDLKGEGVAKDLSEAVRRFRKAADAGDTTAMFNLGNLYDSGEGVSEDQSEAVRWYRKAAEAGDTDAMVELGYAYAKGEGVAPDVAEAERWYRKAADAGDTNATKALQYLQNFKKLWDNCLVQPDGSHVLVGEKKGEFFDTNL